MDNIKIARVFEQMAELLEFRGENPFRIRAYQNGAHAIRQLDEPVAKILQDPDRDLATVPGIGKTLVEKCKTLVDTGTLPLLEQLKEQVPQVVIQMARIPGLGAKKAVKLHDALGVQSLADLRKACEADKVAVLQGFGKKTQASILDGLEIAETAAKRIYWSKADGIAATMDQHMGTCRGILKKQWAGSYRRGRETVGDLDLLVVAKDHAEVMDHLEAYPERTQTIGRGETKISIRINDAFQVDMRCVAEDEFGAALQYFTGSQAHNIHVRRIAKEQGFKVNESGVFRIDDGTKVAGQTEQEVYKTIGLTWITPELREDRGEFDWAIKNEPPRLIELSDIAGDLHMHTSASDGSGTIADMADAAIARGLSYIAITDHSKRVSMAGGLDEERLRDHWKRIDEIRPEYEGRLTILKGIECDILEAGGMDLADDCLAEADWVLASVHYGQQQSRNQITDRIIGAIENPHVHCIAHPTGRLINRRRPYDVDLDSVMQAAKEQGTWMELNANPARLDLNDLHLAKAKKRGIPLVINSDAHSTEGMDVMGYGILQARRGAIGADDVMNTRTIDDFLAALA